MEKIEIFCGISSLGIPNTTDNKDNYGYLDYVQEYLESKDYETNSINFSFLDHNYTWNFNKIFNKNYYLSEIRNIQIRSIDNLRNTNLLFKLIVPKRYQKKLKKMDKDLKITDTYKESNKPIFLYNTGINDMFIFMNGGPVELLNKDIRRNIGTNLDNYIYQAISNVRENIKLLLKLNPNVQIYVLGIYNSFILKLIDTIYKFQDLRIKNNPLPENLLLYIENKFNYYLEELCNEFPNTHFINLAFYNIPCERLDFHPSREGNILIGKIITKKLDKTYLKQKNI